MGFLRTATKKSEASNFSTPQSNSNYSAANMDSYYYPGMSKKKTPSNPLKVLKHFIRPEKLQDASNIMVANSQRAPRKSSGVHYRDIPDFNP